MILSLVRAAGSSGPGRRAAVRLASASVCLAMLAGSAGSALAYRQVSGADGLPVGMDDGAPAATLDVLPPPDLPVADAPVPAQPVVLDPCLEPYDRPELACALPPEAVTFGALGLATGLNVYRFEAVVPGTAIRAELIEAAAEHDLYLVGPGDVVVARAVDDESAPRSVAATVWTPGTHAIYVAAHRGARPGETARYGLRFVAQAPFASLDVPRLPGDALAPAQRQCPETATTHEAEETLFAALLNVLALPCDDCATTRESRVVVPARTPTPTPTPAGGTTTIQKVGQARTDGGERSSQPQAKSPATSAASETKPPPPPPPPPPGPPAPMAPPARMTGDPGAAPGGAATNAGGAAQPDPPRAPGAGQAAAAQPGPPSTPTVPAPVTQVVPTATATPRPRQPAPATPARPATPAPTAPAPRATNGAATALEVQTPPDGASRNQPPALPALPC